MFHVSFRYIFGIPPLILVLLPAASSDCHIKDKDGRAYESVLRISFDELEAAFLNRAARKLRQFLKMNISREFNVHLLKVSRGTQTLVNCTSKEEPLNYLCHMTQRDMTTALQYLLSILRTMLGTFKNSKLGRKKLKGTEKE
ncbi:interleukin-7 isoform X3 [Mastomys coucha]|uniref:interleukin-7 isoform X3 n=1 Tax=Mastomys coucha TaxID=35658 RepID=UPI00126170FB|nr:interleukin-7 isoform X3 [Mastomys coucha]